MWFLLFSFLKSGISAESAPGCRSQFMTQSFIAIVACVVMECSHEALRIAAQLRDISSHIICALAHRARDQPKLYFRKSETPQDECKKHLVDIEDTETIFFPHTELGITRFQGRAIRRKGYKRNYQIERRICERSPRLFDVLQSTELRFPCQLLTESEHSFSRKKMQSTLIANEVNS